MLTVKIKDIVMKPILGCLGRVAAYTHKTGTLHAGSLFRLQSCVVTLMAAMMLSVSPTAYSAAEHDPAAHDASKHDASKHDASKHDASSKVYPSRAAQGVITPLAPGATLHKMTLSHHELEPWSFVPKRKDRIEIENLSNITHAVYVTYPDGTVVNLEIQIPGDVVSWTVPDDAEGEYVFRCWIHPVIRANMMIQD